MTKWIMTGLLVAVLAVAGLQWVASARTQASGQAAEQMGAIHTAPHTPAAGTGKAEEGQTVCPYLRGLRDKSNTVPQEEADGNGHACCPATPAK